MVPSTPYPSCRKHLQGFWSLKIHITDQVTFLPKIMDFPRSPTRLTKDLGHLWLAYIRIVLKAGTLVFQCSLSVNAIAQTVRYGFPLGTLVWKVSQILCDLNCCLSDIVRLKVRIQLSECKQFLLKYTWLTICYWNLPLKPHMLCWEEKVRITIWNFVIEKFLKILKLIWL